MTLHVNPARLLVHQIASANARDTVILARSLNGPGAQARGDQLTRAALSVSSNIAEACGRGTIRQFRQFLLYARGSAQELVSQLGVAKEAHPAQRRVIARLQTRTVLVLKMLRGLYDRPPSDR
jgi:four helix bundle protein